MKENIHFFNKIFRWQLFVTIYISIIQLITIVLLGRYLPYKELGAFAIFQIVFRFALYSLDPGMFFSIIQKHESNKKLVQLLFKKQSLYVIFSIIGFVLLYFYSNLFNDISLFILINSILIILIIAYGSYAQSNLVLKFKQKEIAIAQIIGYSLELIFVVSLCYFLNPMFVFSSGVVLRFIISYGIMYYFVIKQKKKAKQELDLEFRTEQHISQSKFNMWSQILSFVQGQYDSIIIILLFGVSTLGGYILVTEISYMIFAKINPMFNKAIIPVISKAYKQSENTSLLISQSLLSYGYVIIILYFLFWIYRIDIFHLAYPDKYQQLVLYATYLIPIAFIKAFNNIILSYLLALGEAKRIFNWNIIILITNYLLLAVFYYSKISILYFLIFGVFYALISLVILTILLKNIFSLKQIEWIQIGPSFYWTSFIICFVVGAISYLHIQFVWSISLSFITIVVCLYIFEKQRVRNWLKLSIV